MHFRGIRVDQAWRVAFWVILILAALASAVHALLA
jgi:hypothetical protein